jgi:hypothetical protein
MAPEDKDRFSPVAGAEEPVEERRRRRAAMPVRVGSIHDDHDLEMALYYRTRPDQERFEAVEILRRAFWGDNYEATYRLQRSALQPKRRNR